MKRITLITILFIIPLCAWADITSNLQCHIDFENRYADQSTVGRTINKDGTIEYVTGKVGTYAGHLTT